MLDNLLVRVFEGRLGKSRRVERNGFFVLVGFLENSCTLSLYKELNCDFSVYLLIHFRSPFLF